MTSSRYNLAVFLTIGLGSLFITLPAFSAEEAEDKAGSTETSEDETFESGQLDSVKITGSSAGDIDITPGSASVVDREALERFEYDDINRVLATVPGVYIRQEDGYGLRPNIGMRGAASDRSKKVVLMEDGILLGPAPYAAPAAYYFPLVTRMHGVEVYKGPVAIQHGPNTVGGAVNLMTTPIPRRMRLMTNIEGGQDVYGKVHFTYGDSTDQWGWVVEGVRLQTTGFKELDGGGDTGFQKHDVMLKGRWNSEPSASTYHQLDLKLGYGDELSHETYLGLTEDDLRAQPYRRYVTSKNDKMDWQRTQLQLTHSVLVGEDFELRTSLYRHNFERTWRKLNKFKTKSFNEILSNPEFAQNAIYLGVLRGEEDWTDPSMTLEMGSNNRVYYSQGVQSIAKLTFDLGPTNHNFELGVRYHMDQVIRDQSSEGFMMLGGELVSDEQEALPYTDNTDSASALSIHIHDELTWEQLVLTPGLRMEWIQTSRDDRLAPVQTSASRAVILPGLGAYYGLTGELGVFAGVHKGFSPISPGQDESVKAESSLNYELGSRYGTDLAKVEVVGFYNDYSNLVGICTIAGGCPAELQGMQTNVGAATVVGAEVVLQYEVELPAGMTMPLAASYTYTQGTLNESFESADPIFGDAEAGDFIPYVPEHQAWVQLALNHGIFGLAVSGAYTSAMRDQPGQEPLSEVPTSDAYFVVDAALSAQVFEKLSLYVKGDNVLGEEYIVGRRPYGVRPGKPMRVFLGLKAHY